MRPALLSAFAGVVVFALTGCVIDLDSRTGPEQHETQSVDLDKAEMVRVEIKLGAGELEVDGGASKLMDADFTYNVPSWKPAVKYTSSGFRGTLRIEQPGNSHGGSHVKYDWNVRLNDKVPMDISAEFGAGKARMNLGSLDLRSVHVEMGVGEVQLDLRGRADPGLFGGRAGRRREGHHLSAGGCRHQREGGRRNRPHTGRRP